MLLVEEENKLNLEKEIDEKVIEYKGTKSSASLHFLADHSNASAIQLKGIYQGRYILILLDRGCTHCFLKASIAQLFPKKVQNHKPFMVRIANGKELICEQWISQMK